MAKNITKPINLSKEGFFSLRKIVTLLSFVLICLFSLLLFFGAIPFRGRPITFLLVFDYFIEFVNIGKAPFLYIASCVGFSAFYVYVFVKNVIDIVYCVRHIKLWLLSKEDNYETRTEACVVVYKANVCLVRYLMLFMISFMISAFNVSALGVVILCLLILAVTAAMVLRYTLLKGELVESIVISVSRMMLPLAALILVMYNRVQIIDIFNSFVSVFNAFGISSFSNELKLQMLAENLLKPLFCLITWLSIMILNKKVCDYDTKNRGGAKTLLIMNSVFMIAIIVMLGWSNEYTGVMDYFGIIFNNIVFIIVTVLVYLATKNVDTDLNDIPFVTEKKSAEPSAEAEQAKEAEQAEE